jgi:hypothetical protein
MMDWFRKLSPGRKFIVGWNVAIFPIWLGGILYFAFLSGMPSTYVLPILAGILAAAMLGLALAWWLAK